MKTNHLEVIGEVRRYLEQNGRVSLRMLRRQFDLDEASLEELVEEIVAIQRVAARDILAPLYAWFTEGFDTRDLVDAKVLLEL